MSAKIYINCLDAVERFREYCSNLARPVPGLKLPPLDADRECLGMLELIDQYLRAILTLGRAGPMNLAGAEICARTAFEIGAKTCWIAYPDDPVERQNNWLGYWSESVKTWNSMAKEVESDDHEAAENGYRQAAYRKQFIQDMIDKNPQLRPMQVPKMKELLTQLGHPKLYIGYRLMSQTVHGTRESL